MWTKDSLGMVMAAFRKALTVFNHPLELSQHRTSRQSVAGSLSGFLLKKLQPAHQVFQGTSTPGLFSRETCTFTTPRTRWCGFAEARVGPQIAPTIGRMLNAASPSFSVTVMMR